VELCEVLFLRFGRSARSVEVWSGMFLDLLWLVIVQVFTCGLQNLVWLFLIVRPSLYRLVQSTFPMLFRAPVSLDFGRAGPVSWLVFSFIYFFLP